MRRRGASNSSDRVRHVHRVLPPRAALRRLGSTLLVSLLLGACGDSSSSSPTAAPTPSPTPPGSPIILAPEGEDLNAYDPSGVLRKQPVIFGNEIESLPNLPAVNGQPCFDPNVAGRFVIADDAAQPNPPAHWSVMQLHGSSVGDLTYTKLGTLTPSFQGENHDPLGCAFLSDGRLLTTDIGNDASGSANGQLIMWFGPIDGTSQRYCKLDVKIGTAGHVFVDGDDNVYVASARGNAGIFRYAGPFPTSDDAGGGCGQVDAAGAPLATSVNKSRFIAQDMNVVTPNAIVTSGTGTFYVSSVLNGVIAEYDGNGAFIRRVLEPPPGEKLGAHPFSTGTPFGLAVDPSGTLYYADLGLVISGGVGPGDHTGTVRRIRFVDGLPQPPETIDSGLAFPDGIAVYAP